MDDERQEPPRDEVALEAYHVWEEWGRPNYQADACWFEAQERVRRRTEGPARDADASRAVAPTDLDRGLAPAERARARASRRDRPASAAGRATVRPESAHYVIVLDRGAVKIFERDQPPGQRLPGLRLLDAMEFPRAFEAPSGRDSDRQGRFPGSRGRPAGMSIDERLPMQQEQERRLAQTLAEPINVFLSHHPVATWDLAAPADLHRAVLSRLDPAARQRLRHVVAKDLIHEPARRVLEQVQAGDEDASSAA